MSSDGQLPFDDDADALASRDDAARRHATDPRRNIVLEASAGTGKTTVLVNRYVNLLRAGVDPTNILAITFTRKAAAEMRQRIVRELRKAAQLSVADAARWRDLRDRLGDIAISTIDAFCLSLLREFPLEAGLDPGFDIADDTVTARLREDALDRTIAICRRLSAKNESLRLLMAQLGDVKLRRGLERLLDRRLVVRGLLRRFATGAPLPPADMCAAAARAVTATFELLPGGLRAFLEDGPRRQPAFGLVAADLEYLARFAAAGVAGADADIARAKAALEGVRGYFTTAAGNPRKKLASAYDRQDFDSPDAYQRHVRGLASSAPGNAAALDRFDADLNRLFAAGVRRAFAIAQHQYQRELERNRAVDFAELLARTLALLERMDEFSQSRYRLEARYHHVLVDEFQDTSRAQWRLVSLLVKAWGQGAGLAEDGLPPSIFVVGDRKQSIYGFRDAEATILGRAHRDIAELRPGQRVRRAISRSFRSVPALLSFANDLFSAVNKANRPDRFRFGRHDAFPVAEEPQAQPSLGLVVGANGEECAIAVAAEIARLIAQETIVRDPRTGLARPAAPGDVAILFRSREGHQDYERALAARRIAAYVYKGLGFFDADETRDLLALVDYLSRPQSDVAAAAFLRSRFVRLSDCALQRLAPRLAGALTDPAVPEPAEQLDAEDRRVLEQARRGVADWLPLVDRLPPAEIVDRVFDQSAYAYEMRGSRRLQARENVKKMRALMRRIQNRGYATLGDVAAHLRALSAGDESNAVVDAVDAVNLMTVHAAKGLEFPIVFLVNLCRGTGAGRDPIRVVREGGLPSVAIGEFTSEADGHAAERDLEETKRLLYVAVTRARDRLYFSSPVNDGRFEPHRGSLGSVLPESFAGLFNRRPAAEAGLIGWQGTSGRVHRLAVPSVAPADAQPDTASPPVAVLPHDLFDPLTSGETTRIAVTAVSVEDQPGDDREVAVGDAVLPASSVEQPVLGRLVHALFQYLSREQVGSQRADLARRAELLLASSDRPVVASAGDLDARDTALVTRAVEAVEMIRSDSRIEPLLGEGHRWLHEVPFSVLDGAKILRGVIDLLVESEDRVTVVEIKTGAARPEHEQQLGVYRAAAEMLFPGRSTDALLVYARS